jgi:hypothetical protein
MCLHGLIHSVIFFIFTKLILLTPLSRETHISFVSLSQILNEYISGVFQFQIVHLFSMQHVTGNVVIFHVHRADSEPEKMRSPNIPNFHRNSFGLCLGLQLYNTCTLSRGMVLWLQLITTSRVYLQYLKKLLQQHCFLSLCVFIPLASHTSPVSKANK